MMGAQISEADPTRHADACDSECARIGESAQRSRFVLTDELGIADDADLEPKLRLPLGQVEDMSEKAADRRP